MLLHDLLAPGDVLPIAAADDLGAQELFDCRGLRIQTRSDDPSGVLDALRRSRYVDEADLRLAEGILALTDRVTAAGEATLPDYRQALMLYLLYHRSHLGG